jgi:hypothetical protein
MKVLLLLAACLGFAAVGDAPESLPPRDNSDQIEALRRDVDLLLEANSKLETRLSKLESTAPAKPIGQPKPEKLVPSKLAADTQTEPKPGPSIYCHDTKPGHWTYPGDLADHLRTTHGKKVDGMTTEQMLNMHDALHESTPQPVVSQPIIQPQPAMYQQQATCPLGQPCPQRTQPVQQQRYYQSPQRQTLFRRW